MIVKDKSIKSQKEKELAKVIIRKEDVELIVRNTDHYYYGHNYYSFVGT